MMRQVQTGLEASAAQGVICLSLLLLRADVIYVNSMFRGGYEILRKPNIASTVNAAAICLRQSDDQQLAIS
jgi:hypothetical protein